MARYQETAALLLALLSTVSLASELATVPLPYATASYDHELVKIHEQPIQALPGGYIHEYPGGAQGYKIESGIEGYLIPGLKEHVKPAFVAGLVHKIKPFFWKAVAALPKVAVVLVSVVALIAVGTLFTSCICAFTPICHIKFFGVKLNPEQFRGFMTQDRMSEITSFVQEAIKKYQEMNAVENNEVK